MAMPIEVEAHGGDAILVATDGTPDGDRAVSFAIGLARRRPSRLTFCNAIDHIAAIADASGPEGGVDISLIEQTLDDSARSIVAAAQGRALDAGMTAATALLEGRAADAIVEFAVQRRFDAIILGTRSKHGVERLFLGSTADGVLRRSPVPVFIIPPNDAVPASRIERILVAVDDSDPSDAAADFAVRLAGALGATLIVCGIAETGELLKRAALYGYDPTPIRDDVTAIVTAHVAGHVARAQAAGVTCESVVAQGAPAPTIVATSRTHQAGLVVVGTHGRRGLRRLFVGSVAEGVVHASAVPVAVVRGASVDAGAYAHAGAESRNGSG